MTTTRRRATIGALGACLLLLSATACGSDSDPTAETLPAVAAEDTSDPTERAAVVPEALQFTAPLVGGGTFDGTAATGKPTVFWFWAPT